MCEPPVPAFFAILVFNISLFHLRLSSLRNSGTGIAVFFLVSRVEFFSPSVKFDEV